MPTYQRCPDEVRDMAAQIMFEFSTYKPLIEAKVTVDLVFAFPDYNDASEPINDAITKSGLKALGVCRKMPIKDRAMGRADAEITLDGDWWRNASEDEQRALLDHELHHIWIPKPGATDDLRRPIIKMRPHDVEFGWFAVVAQRHGRASIEQSQSRKMMDKWGQFFWPEMCPRVEKV